MGQIRANYSPIPSLGSQTPLSDAATVLKQNKTDRTKKTKSKPLLRPQRSRMKLALKGFATVIGTILSIPVGALVGGVKGAQKGANIAIQSVSQKPTRVAPGPSRPQSNFQRATKLVVGTVGAIFGVPAKVVAGTAGALLGLIAGIFIGAAQGAGTVLNLASSQSLPPASERLSGLVKSDSTFCSVIAGNSPLSEMFTPENKASYLKIENEVCSSFQESMGKPLEDHTFELFSKEDITAAWINKQRFNGEMSDKQFFSLVERGDQLFTSSGGDIEKTVSSEGPEKSDTLALMWGLQALAGKEGFEKGATRVRLKPRIAMRIYDGLAKAGAHSRASTHAQLSRVKDEGLGLDIPTDSFRKYTPFGLGTLLTVPTYQSDADAQKYKDVPFKNRLADMKHNNADIDILFKLEDFGFEDRVSHSVTHVLKVGDKRGIHRESKLVKIAQSKVLEGNRKAKFKDKTSRKEHQSALPKDQQKALQTLAKNLLKKPEFEQFGIKTAVRIKSSPLEHKIGGKSTQLPLGSFVKAVADWAGNSATAADKSTYQEELKALQPLFDKAKISDRFEGMEVLRDVTHPDFRSSAQLNLALASRTVQNFRSIVQDFKRNALVTTISGSLNLTTATETSADPLRQSDQSVQSQLSELCRALNLDEHAETIQETPSLDNLQSALNDMKTTELEKGNKNAAIFHAVSGLATQAAVATPIEKILTPFLKHGILLKEKASARKVTINVNPTSTTVTQEKHLEAVVMRTQTGAMLQKEDVQLKMVVKFTIDHETDEISMEKQFPESAVMAPLKEKVSPETWGQLMHSFELQNIDVAVDANSAPPAPAPDSASNSAAVATASTSNPDAATPATTSDPTAAPSATTRSAIKGVGDSLYKAMGWDHKSQFEKEIKKCPELRNVFTQGIGDGDKAELSKQFSTVFEHAEILGNKHNQPGITPKFLEQQITGFSEVFMGEEIDQTLQLGLHDGTVLEGLSDHAKRKVELSRDVLYVSAKMDINPANKEEFGMLDEFSGLLKTLTEDTVLSGLAKEDYTTHCLEKLLVKSHYIEPDGRSTDDFQLGSNKEFDRFNSRWGHLQKAVNEDPSISDELKSVVTSFVTEKKLAAKTMRADEVRKLNTQLKNKKSRKDTINTCLSRCDSDVHKEALLSNKGVIAKDLCAMLDSASPFENDTDLVAFLKTEVENECSGERLSSFFRADNTLMMAMVKSCDLTVLEPVCINSTDDLETLPPLLTGLMETFSSNEKLNTLFSIINEKASESNVSDKKLFGLLALRVINPALLKGGVTGKLRLQCSKQIQSFFSYEADYNNVDYRTKKEGQISSAGAEKLHQISAFEKVLTKGLYQDLLTRFQNTVKSGAVSFE